MWSRRAVLAALLLAFSPAPAAGHGEGLPYSTGIAFRPADDQTVLLAVTFGTLLSTDDGATFHWVCEDAMGYGGLYDPDFEIAADGAIYVTSFDGLRRSTDGGCTYELLGGALAERFVADVDLASDGAVWAATATGLADNDVFVSRGGGAFTPTAIAPAEALWKSIVIAPGDDQRIYVAGETIVAGEVVAHLRRTVNGGQDWEELPVDAFGAGAKLSILGVGLADSDLVFARVNGVAEDVVYRSPDGGQTWTEVLRLALMVEDNLAFVARADGSYLAGGPNHGVWQSTDGGESFTQIDELPVLSCLGERADGELFACGWNWDPDKFTLGRSTDGASWDPVLRFVQIAGPLECPQGTIQFDTCASLLWPELARMFGIGGGVDAGPDEGDAGIGPDAGGGGGGEGCLGCATSRGGAGGAWLIALVALLLVRRSR